METQSREVVIEDSERIYEWLSKNRVHTKEPKNYPGRKKPEEENSTDYDNDAIKGLKDFFGPQKSWWGKRNRFSLRKFKFPPGSAGETLNKKNIFIPDNYFTCDTCAGKYSYWELHVCFEEEENEKILS